MSKKHDFSNTTNTLTLAPEKAAEFIEVAYQVREPVMLHGTAGIGKSSIVQQVAEKLNIGMIDIRLSQYDFVELRGMPYVDTEADTTRWIAPDILPREGNGILFLDELNSAQTATMAAAYQLINDRRMGEYELPEGWSVVAAGNLNTEGAITNIMPTPLRNRMAHIEFDCTTEQWISWAYKNDVHHAVISFIKNRPTLLNELASADDSVSFDNNPYNAFATPRTWHKVSNVINSMGDVELTTVAKYAAAHVGNHAAFEFSSHCKHFLHMPDLQGILKNPSKFKLTDELKEAPMQIAIAVGLVSFVTQDNVKNFLACIQKLNKEVEVMAVHDLFLRSAAFQTSSDLTVWLHENMEYMV